MKITAAEARIMEALWDAKVPVSAEAVREHVTGEDWTDATVRTLLGRLMKKKAVASQKDGRRYLYSPLIERRTYAVEESRSLLDRLFDGRLAPFVTQFTEQQALTEEDIAELRRLIDRLDRDR